MAFDFLGAGLGIIGSLLGGGGGDDFSSEAWNQNKWVSDRQRDLWNQHGTWDALVAQDEATYANLDKMFQADTATDRNNFLSKNADVMMPGMTDSEWGVQQGVISNALARKRWEAKNALDSTRAMRSRQLMPDMISAPSGGRDNSGGDIFSALSQMDFSDKSKKPGASSPGGSDASGGGAQSQVGTIPAGQVGGMLGPISSFMNAGGGRGGGSAESVNDRYKLPEYGGLQPIHERIADRLMFGDTDPEALQSELKPRKMAGMNRTRPSRKL